MIFLHDILTTTVYSTLSPFSPFHFLCSTGNSTVFFANIYLQNEQEKPDAVPSTKSEGKRKKAAQLKKKKKRKKTKKAENEDKPEQQGQALVDDGIVGDNKGTHLFMFVT